MTVGFACLWGEDERSTWSGTPWHLRAGLREHVEITDLGHRFGPERHLLRVAGARQTGAGPRSLWRYGRVTRGLAGSSINRRIKQTGVTSAVMIQDIAPLDVPYVVYQDLSVDLLRRHLDDGNQGARRQFAGLDGKALDRLRAHQLEVYGQAQAVVAMSQWMADSLVADTGLPPSQVRVVHPGCHLEVRPIEPRRDDGPMRLLFVGREFFRKGGDRVVDAVTTLRARGLDVQCTIAGPSTWTLPTAPSEGIDYVGAVPYRRVAELMASHDVFVMPARFEPFGLVYVEALASGLPVVGARGFAAEEIVVEPDDGRLVGTEPDELLDAIVAVVEQERSGSVDAVARADRARTRFDWRRAGLAFADLVADVDRTSR